MNEQEIYNYIKSNYTIEQLVSIIKRLYGELLFENASWYQINTIVYFNLRIWSNDIVTRFQNVTIETIQEYMNNL